MGIHQRVLAVASLVLLLPPPAFALTGGEVACRDELAATVTRYVGSVEKLVIRCHSKRSSGARSLSDDCNDVDAADLGGTLGQLRSVTRDAIETACTGSEELLSAYPACPVPAASADDGGSTSGIDSLGELADCLIALSDAHAGRVSDDAQGLPNERLLDPLRKCQSKIGKGVSRIVKTTLTERRRCQVSHDQSSAEPGYACDDSDPRDRIAAAKTRFEEQIAPLCTYAPEVLAKLHACSTDYTGLIACSEASASSHAASLIHSVYDLSNIVTTTTTMPVETTTTVPGETTTTLPGTDCGSTFPSCGGTCPVGTNCVAGGSACTCVVDGTGPCAPATIIRTIHAKYGTPPANTSLSTGWSGSAHDVDLPDLTGDVIDVTCDSNCENCAVSMNVQAGSPISNCRCTADPTATCTVINGSDAAHCGQVDPTCRCYFGSPLPLSSAGTPACVVNRIRQDYSGMMNLRSGEWFDQIRLASIVYLGLDTLHPCPTCNGDPVPNDGIRGGTCNGGTASGACDTNGTHATYGPTSFDCLPPTASNVSGTGLLINLNSSTGSQSRTAKLPCDTPADALCPCRTCTGNGNLGCFTNADCEAASAGQCTVGGGAGVKLNECTGFACGASGQCTVGPVDLYCDGNLHPDGRGFQPCTTNSDCSTGTCSVQDLRRCFPDPITAVGDPDTYDPTSGSLFCIAATSNPAINLAAGLPGPGKLLLSFDSDIRCQSNHDLVYEFPSGANCGGGASTTSTTLLPLPGCDETAPPLCASGACPVGQTCGDDGAGGCTCTGLPLPACDDATTPLCGGVCANANELCQDNGAGACACQLPTLPQCASATSPVCGGACPTGEICSDTGGACECGAPGVPPCGSALSPACAGLCDVGSACVTNGTICGCVAGPLPTCAQATPDTQCLGTCAAGSVCQAVLGACQCVGIPIPPPPPLP